MKPKFTNRPNEELKLPDGRTVWLSRSPAVVVVVLARCKEDIFVLTEKRSPTMIDAPNLWAVPSGYLDWDETGWQAVVRELFEETSFYIPKYEDRLITNNNREPWFVNTHPKENNQNVAMTYCLVYNFDKGLPDIEKYKDSEIAEIKWMRISHIFYPEYKWAFKHDERIATAAGKFRNYLIQD